MKNKNFLIIVAIIFIVIIGPQTGLFAIFGSLPEAYIETETGDTENFYSFDNLYVKFYNPDESVYHRMGGFIRPGGVAGWLPLCQAGATCTIPTEVQTYLGFTSEPVCAIPGTCRTQKVWTGKHYTEINVCDVNDDWITYHSCDSYVMIDGVYTPLNFENEGFVLGRLSPGEHTIKVVHFWEKNGEPTPQITDIITINVKESCDNIEDCEVGFICNLNKRCEELLCTTQDEPVCGIDGQTYSNECFAIANHVEIANEGACVTTTTSTTSTSTTTTTLNPTTTTTLNPTSTTSTSTSTTTTTLEDDDTTTTTLQGEDIEDEGLSTNEKVILIITGIALFALPFI